MNIAVIGTGGVGGYFGGKLTRLMEKEKDLRIYFVARYKRFCQFYNCQKKIRVDIHK